MGLALDRRWRRKLAEPELRITREPRPDGERLAAAPVRWHHEDDDTIDLAPYIVALRERWRTIASAALAGAMATALVTGLVLHKWYRAKAVIRPIATPAIEGRIAGVLGGLGGGFGLSGLAASLGAGGNNDAEEYIAIMRGFEFSVDLAEHHHLSKELLKPGLLGLLYSPKIKDPQWAIYRVLEKRFDCEYSIRTGNITLYFQARNRPDAEKVLGYYIGDLRGLLRTREISSTSSAIESLEAEAKTTPDAVLRTELYDLIAKQIQRKKMAQVEADFAFRVLDPPAASDKHYRPWIVLDSILALLIVGSFTAISLVLRNPAGNVHVSRS
jgi:Chain length determinant protein